MVLLIFGCSFIGESAIVLNYLKTGSRFATFITGKEPCHVSAPLNVSILYRYLPHVPPSVQRC